MVKGNSIETKRVSVWTILWHTLKTIAMLSVLGSSVFVIITYFAPAKAVLSLQDQIDLKTSQNIVRYKEHNLINVKQEATHKLKDIGMTPFEKDIVKKAEDEYLRASTLHKKRIEQYEEKHGQSPQL